MTPRGGPADEYFLEIAAGCFWLVISLMFVVVLIGLFAAIYP